MNWGRDWPPALRASELDWGSVLNGPSLRSGAYDLVMQVQIQRTIMPRRSDIHLRAPLTFRCRCLHRAQYRIHRSTTGKAAGAATPIARGEPVSYVFRAYWVRGLAAIGSRQARIR